MKIVLLGYMGSGKSTIAKKLTKKVNIKTVDLDSYISDKEGDTISNIFKKKGEIYFRKQEGKYLKTLLEMTEDLILALGGGTPCYGDNMAEINDKAISIYLEGSWQILFNRLRQEKASRPLIANLDDDQLKEFIAKHLFERNNFYKQAQLCVSIDQQSPEDIVNKILELI